MKKLSIVEEKTVNGGATYTYTCSDVCSGRHAARKLTHSTTIKGVSNTSMTAAKKSYNSKLSSHKNSTQYRDHTHSGRAVSV